MAEGKIRVKFEAKDSNKLISAIRSLNTETKKLTGSTRKYEATGQRLPKNVNNQNKAFGALGGTLSVLRSKFLLYGFAVQQVSSLLLGASKRASQFTSLKDSFDDLTTSANFSTDSFEKLAEATDGTISKMDLYRQANNALLLGIFDSSDQMAEMFDIAQRLGKALGQDTVMSIESLVTGLGRQSKLMLDNLGIVFSVEKAYKEYANELGKSVDALTDAEKKQAFTNKAIKEAKGLVSDLSEETFTLADAINLWGAATQDFLTESAPSFLAWLFKVTPRMDLLDSKWESYGKTLTKAKEAQAALNFEAQQALKKNPSAEFVEGQNQLFDEFSEEFATAMDRIMNTVNDVDFESLKSDLDLSHALNNSSMASMNFRQEMTVLTEEEQELADGIKKVNIESDIQRHKFSNLSLMIKGYATETVQAANLTGRLGEAITSLAGKNKSTAIFGMRVSAGAAIASGIAGAAKAFEKGGVLGYISGTAMLAETMVRVNTINSQIRTLQAEKFETGGLIGGRRHSQGGTLIEAERGEFVMSRNAVSAIGVENLNRMNQGQSGSGSINISINGGMISPDFVENELAEAIREATRKGASFGLS